MYVFFQSPNFKSKYLLKRMSKLRMFHCCAPRIGISESSSRIGRYVVYLYSTRTLRGVSLYFWCSLHVLHVVLYLYFPQLYTRTSRSSSIVALPISE